MINSFEHSVKPVKLVKQDKYDLLIKKGITDSFLRNIIKVGSPERKTVFFMLFKCTINAICVF